MWNKHGFDGLRLVTSVEEFVTAQKKVRKGLTDVIIEWILKAPFLLKEQT